MIITGTSGVSPALLAPRLQWNEGVFFVYDLYFFNKYFLSFYNVRL